MRRVHCNLVDSSKKDVSIWFCGEDALKSKSSSPLMVHSFKVWLRVFIPQWHISLLNLAEHKASEWQIRGGTCHYKSYLHGIFQELVNVIEVCTFLKHSSEYINFSIVPSESYNMLQILKSAYLYLKQTSVFLWHALKWLSNINFALYISTFINSI